MSNKLSLNLNKQFTEVFLDLYRQKSFKSPGLKKLNHYNWGLCYFTIFPYFTSSTTQESMNLRGYVLFRKNPTSYHSLWLFSKFQKTERITIYSIWLNPYIAYLPIKWPNRSHLNCLYLITWNIDSNRLWEGFKSLEVAEVVIFITSLFYTVNCCLQKTDESWSSGLS
jgi:hypothetical protein